MFYVKKSMAGKVLTLKGIGDAGGSKRVHITAQFHSGDVTPSRTDSFTIRTDSGTDYPLLLTVPSVINTPTIKVVIAMQFSFQGLGLITGGYNLLMDGAVISEDTVSHFLER